MDHQERKTISVEEAAKLLGISRGAAYAAAARGDLPVIRIGRLLLISKVRMQRLLDGVAESA
jgi:excisionase family DNA binding protein